jgi:hypothetical protein
MYCIFKAGFVTSGNNMACHFKRNWVAVPVGHKTAGTFNDCPG